MKFKSLNAYIRKRERNESKLQEIKGKQHKLKQNAKINRAELNEI